MGQQARPQQQLVLVVDDHPEVLRFLTRVLESEGCAVTAATNGADAIAMLESGQLFDLVISDYSMPGADGLAVMRAARRHLPQARALLISSSALDGPLLEEADRLRVSFQLKPLDLQALKGFVCPSR